MLIDKIKKFRSAIPFTRLFPVATFVPRSKDKIRNIQWLNPKLRFNFSAKIIQEKAGLSYLELKHTTSFFKKGTVVVIPNDGYLPARIKLFGQWAGEVSKFLDSGITKETVLLDIGAHCGLVSLQTYNLSGVKKIYAVEPKSINFEALKLNMNQVAGQCEVILKNIAIANSLKSSGYIYSEPGATMNSGINNNLPGLGLHNSQNLEMEKVKLINATVICNDFLNFVGKGSIALKCDVQGYDVIILSAFSKTFWKKVVVGSIEVSAVTYATEKEIDLLLNHLIDFKTIYLNTDLKHYITRSEIKNFYLSKSNKSINLYFKKI